MTKRILISALTVILSVTLFAQRKIINLPELSGLMVSGDPLICFSALNYIHDDFESPGKLSQYRKDAKTANTHTIDIKPREIVKLNIDLAQMGVGGDNSWGARIHPQYRLMGKKYEYSFRLRPVAKEDDILKLAKEKY